MSWLGNILGRFGRGGESHVGADRVRRSIEQRFNPMRQLTPENLSRWIDEFECGELRPLARLLEAVSERDDMFKSTMRKAIRSVSRCDYDIRIEEGAEGSEAAKAHRDVLVDFWRTVRATELLNQSAVGGVCRLVRQMMLAERDCHNVHELLWRVEGGKLRLTAVHVPLWMFENRTGHLRFLRDNHAIEGEPLVPGEWLVHSGDGVGIACAIAASYKRLTLGDWLAYSEHNATPGLHAKTDARQGSPEWQRAVEAVRAFAQDWAIVTGRDVDMNKIDLGASGSLPYPALVEAMNKSIAALWRGSDLGTLSAQAQGASLQGEEMDMLEQSAAEDISETLHEQIDRFVIEWHFGAGTEPLARFALVPVSRPDVQKEIAINEHLVSHGAKLSLADECQRFGRREVGGGEKDRPMEAAQQPGQPAAAQPAAAGRGLGMWNEDTAGEPPASPSETRLARAMQRDLRPVAKAIAEGLKKRDWGALRKRLSGMLPEFGTESADVLEDAMREAGGEAQKNKKNGEEGTIALANVTDANGMEHADKGSEGGGRFVAKNGGDSTSTDNPSKEKRVQGGRESFVPRNDGKIDFHGNNVAHGQADDQAKELGYRSIEDLLHKSTAVPKAKIDSILAGGDMPCEAHEAVAALRTCASIPSGVVGEQPVKLGERPLQHYICGRGRKHGGKPEVKRLRILPQAIQAVRHPDSYSHELEGKTIVKYPGEALPKGTQTVYKANGGKTFAFTDSGVLTGWQNY